jgi:toxin-antitoxin system PIN domain toxin
MNMMDVLDVNVLVNAYRGESKDHSAFAQFVMSLLNGNKPFAVPSLSLSGLVRIATHPRVFKPPSPIDDVLTFVEQLRSQAHCLIVVPGERHWEIFIELCRRGNARGGLVSDAYLAAMAIEMGAELVTADRGFGRWPGLRWRHPLDN